MPPTGGDEVSRAAVCQGLPCIQNPLVSTGTNPHFRTNQTEETLARALSRVLGAEVQLQIELAEEATQTPARELAQAAEERLQAARVELENDPTVRALQERLGATLIADSIKPLN